MSDRILVTGGAGYVGSHTVRILARTERIIGRTVPPRLGGRRPGDASAIWADASMIAAELGWRATRGLDEMLGSAWRWHRHEHEYLCGTHDDLPR